jgi:flagellin-like hook-associated protein FlgL
MRIPNLSVSNNITKTISDLNQKRIKLDQQISSGQKMALPEDDGMTMGRIIDLETQKSTLTQYQRNASYASEFLNTGYLNLDKLREINVRGQEIARTASTGLNAPGNQTYGHEINQLIEEVLNRLNASHRNRSLFGGTQLKPEFGNSEVQLGKKQKKEISFDDNSVGFVQNDGKRSINKGEKVILDLNGREYVVESKKDNLSATEINNAFSYLINYDSGELNQSPAMGQTTNPQSTPNANLSAYVRSSIDNAPSRNKNVLLNAKISLNGNLEVYGNTGQTFEAKASYVHRWNPNQYFPAQVDDLIKKETESRFPGISFDDLPQSDQELVRFAVFSSDRLQEILDREAKSVDDYITVLDSELAKILSDENRLNEFLKNTSRSKSDYDGLTYRQLDAADQEKVRNDLFQSGYELPTGQPTPTSVKNFTDLTPDEKVIVESKVFSQNWISNELERESQLLHAKPFNQLSANQQDNLRAEIFSGYIPRDLQVASSFVSGDSTIEVNHAADWRRLEIYELGDVIRHEGKVYESKIENNRNHRPNSSGSDYWRELSNDYPRDREDWELENIGQKTKSFYMSADGKLFSSKQDAENHSTKHLAPLLNTAPPAIKKVFLSVDDFRAKGSNTDGLVTFDPETLEYRLSSVPDGGNVFESDFVKGTSIDTSNPNNGNWESQLADNQVIQHEGRYYLITDSTKADKTTWPFLQASFPPIGKVHQLTEGVPVEVNTGEYILNQDANGKDQYYVATSPTSVGSVADLGKAEIKAISEHSDGSVFLLDKLPHEGEEILYDNSPIDSVQKGQYIFLPGGGGGSNNSYYVALEDVPGAVALSGTDANTTTLDDTTKFRKVDISVSEQGDDWSYDANYEYGQIVYFEGKYYERIDYTGSNFATTPATLTNPNGSTNPYKPSDEFITVGDESLPNNRWRLIDDFGKPLNHVLKFKSAQDVAPTLVLPDAGRAGTSAEARPIIDANGNIAGIKVENPGRYFFGIDRNGAVPPDFSKVSILLDGGRETDATIIWGQDSADPGAYKIAGFTLNNQNQTTGITHNYTGVENVASLPAAINVGDKIHDIENDRFFIAKEQFSLQGKVVGGVIDFDKIVEIVDFVSDLPNGSDRGDTFSFSTGSKTFLDHRNDDGDIVGVTYMGSNKNSEFSIGKDSKVSAFLSADKDGTKELTQTLDSLITIRDGLLSSNPLGFSKEIQKAETALISHEDQIINQMGEITSNIVRMDTAKAHDEEYFMELDLRISRDIDIDLSEAIMRLTQVSTAYQASLQIGSQLLNTSLLNYL